MSRLLRDSFPTAHDFEPSERSMTAIDSETGERVNFRDFQTMEAYNLGVHRLERIEWLSPVEGRS